MNMELPIAIIGIIGWLLFWVADYYSRKAEDVTDRVMTALEIHLLSEHDTNDWTRVEEVEESK